MRDMHMLNVWPWLKYCRCCFKKRKPDFKLALKASLRLKMDLKVSKSEKKLQEDPFLTLGNSRCLTVYRIWNERLL